MVPRLGSRICRGRLAARDGEGFDPPKAGGLFGKRSQFYAFASKIVAIKDRKGQGGLLASTNEIFGELPVEPICVRVSVAVKLTGMSRSPLYELIGYGEVEAVKVGRSTFITVAG